jgi:predicted transcriptional regulator
MPRKKSRRKPGRIREMLGPLEAEVIQIIWAQGPSLVSEIEVVLNEHRSALD